jgi:CO/xanthine dehydrogenase Mo-binding subunit
LLLGTTNEDVVLDGGFLHPSEFPDRRVPVSEVVQKLKEEGRAPVGEGVFNPETTSLDLKTGQGSPYGTYAFATQGALVSVDMDTGEIEVLDIVACHDVGKVVNPINVVAQIEGGVSMGVGYGLMEEVLVKQGAIRNPRFSEYYVPTVLDMPEVTSLLVEREEPTGPFGAKGVGEPALLPTAPAILNAVAVATGIRVKEIPVTSEKLWKLLKKD